jgi:hypothetical protein
MRHFLRVLKVSVICRILSMVIIAITLFSNSAVAATVILDDNFLGTGGVPAGWVRAMGSLAISHSGSIVTIQNNDILPTVIRSNTTYNPQGTRTILVTEVSGTADNGGSLGIASVGSFNVILRSDGSLNALATLGGPSGVLPEYFLTTVSGYTGGALDVTMEIFDAGFKVATDTGYESSEISWVTAFGGSFNLSTLGSSVSAQLAAVGSNPVLPAEISVDRITLTTVPIPAAAWLFGSALGMLVCMRKMFKYR